MPFFTTHRVPAASSCLRHSPLGLWWSGAAWALPQRLGLSACECQGREADLAISSGILMGGKHYFGLALPFHFLRHGRQFQRPRLVPS